MVSLSYCPARLDSLRIGGEGKAARGLSHAEIARRVAAAGATLWWAQSVAVAYERHIGRREPGQGCDGEYSVSVSKTVAGNVDEVLARWASLIDSREGFPDVPISCGPETSATDAWRYWRCGLVDGSRVNVNIREKSGEKAVLGIQHERLESTELAEHWRAFWKSIVKEL